MRSCTAGKTPEAIRLKEEISHAERRKKLSEKSLAKLEEQQAKGDEQLAVMEEELTEIAGSISKLEGARPNAQPTPLLPRQSVDHEG